ncbi:MAG: hypothetical protein Kow0020_10820 [Wenzhouxiangellaceae bacterium]
MRLLIGAVLLLSFGCALAQVDEVLRLSRDELGRPVSLDTVIIRLSDDSGRIVDLVGAIHMAEPAYYDALNARLAGYDWVLYELVGDPAALDAPRAGGALSVIGLIQGGLTEALGLVHQLEAIDYSREHFVHADLDVDEFQASMRERQESWFQMLLRAWALGLASADPSRELAWLKVWFAPDRQLALKRLMAEELIGQIDLIDRLGGESGSTLIEVRNAHALQTLDRVLSTGARRVAIFYGAGHLPDLADALERNSDFRRAGVEWLPAWSLSDGSDPGSG